MKKYIVWDKQGCDFMDWTFQNPQTAHQIRSYLYDIHKDECDEPMTWNAFTIDFCEEHWELEFIWVEELDIDQIWEKYGNEYSDESLKDETIYELLDTLSDKTGKLIEPVDDRPTWYIQVDTQ